MFRPLGPGRMVCCGEGAFVFAGFRRRAVELLESSGKSVPVLARELSVSPQTLRNWRGQVEVDQGRREGLTSDERDELRRLRRENPGERVPVDRGGEGKPPGQGDVQGARRLAIGVLCLAGPSAV